MNIFTVYFSIDLLTSFRIYRTDFGMVHVVIFPRALPQFISIFPFDSFILFFESLSTYIDNVITFRSIQNRSQFFDPCESGSMDVECRI